MPILTGTIDDVTGSPLPDRVPLATLRVTVRAPSRRSSLTEQARLVASVPVPVEVSPTGEISVELEPGPAVMLVEGEGLRDVYELGVTADMTLLTEALQEMSPTRSWVESQMVQLRSQTVTAAADALDAAIATGQDRAHVDSIRQTLDEAAQSNVAPYLTQSELNATYESLEASSARWAPGKADGRNVRNLRRPTLAVDKMFPNARHDHQIVWVDESEKIAYAISQDDRLYKSTWTAEGNEALQFTVNRSGAAVGTRWAPDGVFLRLPDGTLLMETTIGIGGLTKLVRSTDDGLTWTTVWTSPGDGKRFLGPQSVAVDENTGHIYMCEYTSETTGTNVAIYRSTDDGATWPVWVSKARSEQTTTGYLRHFHSCRYDPISERMYFTAGDNQVDAGIYRVNAAGDNIEAVLKNSDVSAQFGVSSPARAVDLMFFPDYIAWASDGSGGNQNHIYRMSRASIGTGSPVVERIAATDNTGWYAVRAAEDGSAWVVSSSTETSTNYPYNPDSGVVHLYAVTNNGAQVDDLAAVEMGGNPVGFASLSGMGGGSGDGQAFWLRAHNYWFYPNRRPSSFQFRARLANGVVPIIKPSNQRQNEVVRQTFNWQGTLDPGESKVFGVTRVPAVMNFLSVLEHGAFVTTGTGGAALLEVWDGNSSIRAYASASTSWRADTNSATAERLGSVGTFTSGNRVEFRIKNTDTANPITATANITFGWSFL